MSIGCNWNIDSINDLDQITVVWDLDTSVDSNGDGVKDNDADKIGKQIEHVFTREGSYTIRVIAWDENPERPGTRVINVEIGAPERTIVEELGLPSSAMKPILLFNFHCWRLCFLSSA